jgi:hypothetical protein
VAGAQFDKDYVFDLMRGVARFTGSDLVAALARTIAKHPDAPLDNAFNHKQVASKQWARDMLASHTDARFETIWLMGGWLGILPAMLFDDDRFTIGRIISFDVDPSVGAVAETLNRLLAGEDRFSARTADMYELNYTAPDQPDMVHQHKLRTHCRPAALARPAAGRLPGHAAVERLFLRTDAYQLRQQRRRICAAGRSEPAQLCRLAEAAKYTRFMLIGRV